MSHSNLRRNIKPNWRCNSRVACIVVARVPATIVVMTLPELEFVHVCIVNEVRIVVSVGVVRNTLLVCICCQVFYNAEKLGVEGYTELDLDKSLDGLHFA